MADQKTKIQIPTWYTPDEMRHYLIRHNYSQEISDELAQRWADDLQSAFEKGYQKGYSNALTNLKVNSNYE
jgi:hypothetical protein